MKSKALWPAMLAGLILSAFSCWYILYRAVTVPEASIWSAPITVFFIFLVVFFLCTVLVKRTAYLGAATGAAFLLSLFFAPTALHFSCLMLAVFLALGAVRNVRENLGPSLKLRFFNSFMSGRSYIIFALIVAVTSQYYALVSRAGREINLPKFELSRDFTLSLGKIYGHINPKYSFFSTAREMTVDEFILQNQGGGLSGQDPVQAAAARESLLEQGRIHLSGLSGKRLSGGEQAADVFPDLATRKINAYFAIGMAQSGKSSPFPLFLTTVLFLTLLPIAAIVGYAGTLFSALLCGALLRAGLIKKKTTQVQAEALIF